MDAEVTAMAAHTPVTTGQERSEAELRVDEARVCSRGDTVHYDPQPKFFTRCEGSYVFDRNDTPYLDLQMWYSAVNFGYANPRINGAVKRQLDTLPQIASQFLHDEKIELSVRLADSIQERFGDPGRIHFNVGGSQAVEDALKLVRNASGGRSLMFAFEGGYHGRTLGASAITSSYRYRRRYGHFGERASFIPFPYCFRCPYGKKRDTCDLYCAKQFDRLFDSEYQAVWDPKVGQSEFAAFFIEVVQGTGGYVMPPPGYFEHLQSTLEARKILIVDDEIQMGFFRTGRFWAAEHVGLRPDIIVFGKSLTNGLNPLAGVWAREELIGPEVFPPGSTHSTFASNPLGTAAGLETLKLLAEDDYALMTTQKGAYFMNGLRELARQFPEMGDVDGLGLAMRIEICERDGFTPNKALTDHLVIEGLKGDLVIDGKRHGLVLDVGGYYKNVLTLAPPLTISYAEIDQAMELLGQLFARCVRQAS